MARKALLLILLLVAASMPFQVSADDEVPGTTYTYPETFESYLSGQIPDEAWYTVTSTGSGSQAANSISPITGTMDWRITDGATAYATQMGFTASANANADLCFPGAVFSFKAKTDAAPQVLSAIELGIHGSGTVSGAQAPPSSMGVRITGASGAETVALWVRGTTQNAQVTTLPVTYSAGSVLNIQISQVNCGGTSASALFTITGTSSDVTQTVTAPSGGTITTPITDFRVASNGAVSPTGTNIHVDDYNLAGIEAPPPFVPNPPLPGGMRPLSYEFEATNCPITGTETNRVQSFEGFSVGVVNDIDTCWYNAVDGATLELENFAFGQHGAKAIQLSNDGYSFQEISNLCQATTTKMQWDWRTDTVNTGLYMGFATNPTGSFGTSGIAALILESPSGTPNPMNLEYHIGGGGSGNIDLVPPLIWSANSEYRILLTLDCFDEALDSQRNLLTGYVMNMATETIHTASLQIAGAQLALPAVRISPIVGGDGGQLDNFELSGAVIGEETITVANPPLTSMVLSDEDQALITRQSDGDLIRTYDPNAMSTGLASTNPGNCNSGLQGVGAMDGEGGSYVIYALCQSNGNLDKLQIRTPFLTTPTNGCSSTYCTGAEMTNEATDNGFPAEIQQIGNLQAAKYDFSRSDEQSCGGASVFDCPSTVLSIAYTVPNQNVIGVFGFQYVEQPTAVTANGETKTLQVGPTGSSVADICTTGNLNSLVNFANPDHPDYRNRDSIEDKIAGVISNSATWGVQSRVIHQDTVAFGEQPAGDIDVDIQPWFQAFSPYTSKIAVSCGPRLIAANSTAGQGYTPDLDSALWAVSDATQTYLASTPYSSNQITTVAGINRGALTRGLDLATDAPYIAVVSADAVRVYDYSNVTEANPPVLKCYKPYTGTFKDVHLGSGAKTIWLATTTQIYRFKCTETTPEDFVSLVGSNGCPDTDGDNSCDSEDLDCDNDGTLNGQDTDDDNDGIPDTSDDDLCGNLITEGPGANGAPSSGGGLGGLGDGILKDTGTALAEAFGVDEEGGAMILCLMLILFFAAAAGSVGNNVEKGRLIGRGWGPMGFAIGAGLGFALCLVLGLIGLLAAFVITSICGAIISAKFFRGR